MPAAPHTGVRKVNRTVTYIDSAGSIRPAIITGLGAGNLVNLRVGHHGETYSNVDHITAVTQTGRWYFGARRHV